LTCPRRVLAPHGIGEQVKVYVCPSAIVGWPKAGGPYRFTYRDAGINQPNGVESIEGSYFREAFAFLDGRKLDVTPIHFTGDPIPRHGAARRERLADRPAQRRH
jgi:hypothetical protein